jgi:transcriptional regulator with XRE-family HTH domain
MDEFDRAISIGQARRRLPTPDVRRHIRQAAGVSQRALAREVGVNVAQISRWENGVWSPSGHNAITYAAALKRLMEAVA